MGFKAAEWGTVSIARHAVASEASRRQAVRSPAPWTRTSLRWAALADCGCALAAGALAVELRFAGQGQLPVSYLAFTVALPAFWWAAVALSGGYKTRFIGVGSEEFRRVLNAAVCLTAGVAIFSYTFKFDFARGYFMIALPCTAVFDVMARYRLRKRLHSLRSEGFCTQRVIA